jgi:hypothetical protein
MIPIPPKKVNPKKALKKLKENEDLFQFDPQFSRHSQGITNANAINKLAYSPPTLTLPLEGGG